MWEIEVPLPVARFDGPEDVAALEQAFHAVHEELFAFSDPDSAIEIVAWRAQVRCRLRAATDVSTPVDPEAATADRVREAYFSGSGTLATPVRRFAGLAVGERFAGPLIVESPVTTVVVPPGAAVQRLPSGSLLLDPGRADAAAADATPDATPIHETEAA